MVRRESDYDIIGWLVVAAGLVLATICYVVLGVILDL